MSPEYQQTLKEVLLTLTSGLAENCTIEIAKEGDQWRVVLNSDQNEKLIGDDGENLKSLQHLTRVIIHKKFPEDKTHFLLDVRDYRQNRENVLKDRLYDIAQNKVLSEGATVILIGLSSYERKIVHSFLKEIQGLETTSVGPDTSRKLIVRPTSELGSTGMDNAVVINLFEKVREYSDEESSNE